MEETQRKFFIQWDSTNDCNLRCEHCYHNREGEEHRLHQQENSSLMTLDEVKEMLNDLKDTTTRWNFSPRFQISGGEPLMRKDLMDIVEYSVQRGIETRLLTNGTLITSEKAKQLKQLGVNRLQISLDGDEETHNRVRKNPMAYRKALEGISNCKNASIDVTVSMTALQSNKNKIESVIEASYLAGAKYVGIQSFVPNSRLGLLDPEFIGAEETYEIYKKIRGLSEKYERKIKVLQTEVLWQAMQWDTQIKASARNQNKFLSGCGAGYSGIAVLSDGTVYPCRRLPIPIGHISEGLVKIMTENEVLKELRNLDKMKEKSCGCSDVPYCRGCRAVAYAVTGDYMAKDPMCIKPFVKSEDIEARVIKR